MKKKIICILISSIILVIFINVLLLFYPYAVGISKIFLHIIFSIWFFSLIPSYAYFIIWLNGKSFKEQIFIGIVLDLIGLIFVPILVAPYFMVKFYLYSLSK